MKKVLFVLSICGLLSVLSATPTKMNLSGGTRGGHTDTVYFAPNGTVVTSTVASYPVSGAYMLKHMFNGTLANSSSSYWLPNTHSQTTLTLDFNQTYFIDSVNVYTPDSVHSHHGTKYHMEVSSDGVTYSSISNSHPDADNNGFITGDQDPLNFWRTFTIQQSISHVRFQVQTTQTWMYMNEIEVFEDANQTSAIANPDPVVPEPASGVMLLVAVGIGSLLRIKKR